MSENNERNSAFRQPFLALMASLAAFMAIFGVKIPDPGMPKKASDATSESTAPAGEPENAFVEPSVVLTREWDDPFKELGRLLADQQKNPKPCETSLRAIQKGKDVVAIQKLLRNKLLPSTATNSSCSDQTSQELPPKLLIMLQIVAGPSHANAKESRTLWSHAYRMALSGAGFNKCEEQLVAALECDLVTDHGVSAPITRRVVLPMKLFERSDPPNQDDDVDCKPDSSTPKHQRKQRDYILNVWLMDDYLGENPWTCIQSVCSAVQKVLGTSEDKSIRDRTKLAIVGPGGSGLLKRMDPTKSLGVGSFDPSDLSSDSLVWVNAHCTVPLRDLWEYPGPDKQGERWIEAGRVKIRYLESTPNDGVLIDLLAHELDQRLGSVIPVSKWGSNRILVFHEDDSAFGKNLIRSLEKKLCPMKDHPSKYSITAFPYLRGIGLTRESSGKSKESSPLTDVADYFRRTIDMYHEKSDEGNFYGNQPIAIGILGGGNEDKIALLNQIRIRYPQSLVFTNDLNVQYLNVENLPHTRNLLIAAHAGLNTTLDDRYEKRISFRDESQTTLWNGYKRLFDQTLGNGLMEKSQTNTGQDINSPSKAVPAYLFEVGNNQFMSILRSDELATPSRKPFEWVRGCLAAVLGCFTIWTLFTFPMLHALWPAHLRFGRRLLSWLGNLIPPRVSVLSTRFGFPIEDWSQTQARLLGSFKNAAVVLAVASLLAVCLLPLTASECTWISDPSTGTGWLMRIRNDALNRTTTWLTGVSVVPSVILLAICLPLTFWPAIKKDIERAFGLEAGASNATQGDAGQSMDQRVASIRQKIERIGEYDCTPGPIALPIPHNDAAKADPCNDQSIRDRLPVALAYLVCGAILSLIFSMDDPWMIQMTLLAVVTSLTSSCPTVRLATLFSFLVGVAITFVGWLFDDIPYVPARDPWIRAVASCAFAVAYWWLLIGLVKLFIHQRNLRKLLRHGTRTVERLCDHRIDMDRRVDSERRLKLADEAMSETQSVSRIISRDLSQLTFVGLIICFARMPWFDAWGMSLATWLTIVLPMAAPFVSSIFLRRRGFEFRDACLRYQSELGFQASTHGANSESALDAKTAEAEKKGLEEFGKRLSGWQARFKGYDRGVFSPLDKDPMISTGLSLLLAFFSGPQGDLFKRIASFLFI